MEPLDPPSTAARQERKDPSPRSAARGIVLAVPVAALLWAVIFLAT